MVGRPNSMASLLTSILLISAAFLYSALARTLSQAIPTQTVPLPNTVDPQASPLAGTTEPKKLSFFLHGVLGGDQRDFTAAPIPFAKPAGVLPPKDGILIPDANVVNDPLASVDGGGAEPAVGFETGVVTAIDGDLTEGHEAGSPTVGRAKGIYVVSSEDGGGPLIALTVTFSVAGGEKDSLSFFGVHRMDGLVSHVPVVGGTGKYENANGYASIRSVGHIDVNGVVDGMITGLRFTVHLDY
ncbi:dirigent protein 18-like [Nymphaea colorata]|nr:dirigent protein 18-like [Nymphaea colorata]